MRKLSIHNRLCAVLLVLLCSLTPHGCRKEGTEPAFDIPALLGKKIDAVQATLKSAPIAAPPRLQPAATAGEEYRAFKKDNWYLIVAYRPENGRVLNFSVGTDENGGTLKEKERFLRAGRLREDNALYNIEYIEAPDTVFSYSGVRITPQPINHDVIFRITGSEDVFYINYSLRPASGPEKSNKFVTVPPWEEHFTAATGTRLLLEATPSSQAIRRSTTGPMKATVEIVVDGKVAQQGKLVGLWAKCEMEIEY